MYRLDVDERDPSIPGTGKEIDKESEAAKSGRKTAPWRPDCVSPE